MLEEIWIRSHKPGDGTFFILAGFANYNGGARFFHTFKEHTEHGGRIAAILGGSSSQRTSSRQLVEALLDCGADVHVTNRKSLMHAKCYGVAAKDGNKLVVTSGNFTGPGMARNVEAALLLDATATRQIGFSWTDLFKSMLDQTWPTYGVKTLRMSDPVWPLLYDEGPGALAIEQSEMQTLVVKLGHADTARIMASPGTTAGLGSQYFWLSKDCFDFFPPLTIRNKRGYKGTLSALIQLKYVDLDEVDSMCRVTYEAENNYDFRLGTGKLRYTKLADDGDMACITRVGDSNYQLRILRRGSEGFQKVAPYATTYIGGTGKLVGFVDNPIFGDLLGTSLD